MNPSTEFPLAVRPATEEDLEALVALMRELAEYHAALHPAFEPHEEWEEVWREYIQSQLEGEEQIVLVAEWEGKPVGFANASIIVRPAFKEGRRGSIHNLVVSEPFRRRGIGRLLTEALYEWFRERSVRLVELEVAVQNTLGRRFWEELGFEPLMLQMGKWLSDKP